MRAVTILAEELVVGDRFWLDQGWCEILEINVPVCVNGNYTDWVALRVREWSNIQVFPRGQSLRAQLTEFIPQEGI